MSRGVFILTLCVAIVACGGAPQKRGPSDVEDLVFSAPLDTPLVVQIGDEIFVSGKAITLGTLEMSNGITSRMPGAYGVEFDFGIDKTTLVQEFDRGPHRYFCAPEKDRSATYRGRSVVAPRDCVGIRESVDSGEREWVVDNSYHNGTTTVWSRPVMPEDSVSFVLGKRREYGGGLALTKITFDGYYSDLLHFTLTEYEGREVKTKQFHFDGPKEKPVTVGIKGNIFEVLRVTGTEMEYQWKSLRP